MLANEGSCAVEMRKLFLKAGGFSAFAGVCEANSCVRQQLEKMSMTCDEMGKLFWLKVSVHTFSKGEQHKNKSIVKYLF